MTAATARGPRLALALAATLTLLLPGGCGRVGNALDITGQVAKTEPRPIGPERLQVTLPATGARATLAPVARSGDVTVWQALDGITVAFRRGLLIETRGLDDDLMSSDVSGNLAMLSGAGNDGYYPHIRSYLDGEDWTVFRSFQCRRTGQARQQVAAGGNARPLRRIEETCVSPDRKFTNTYWLDGAGGVVKSRQWVSPTIEFMETERVLR